MALIGVHDADFFKYENVIPNLECAKLMTYFYNHNEIAMLTPHLDPAKYTNFYYRKDYDDGIYPEDIFASNCIYGGRAFHPKEYKPLEKKIEATIPNMHVYDRYLSYFGKNTAVLKRILNCAHVRLETSTFEQLKRNFITRPTGIILHDYNLTTKNSYEILHDLQNSRYFVSRPDEINPYPIGNKFPIQIYSEEELRLWDQMVTIPNALCLQYNGLMSDSALNLLKDNKRLSSQLYYEVTYGLDSEIEFLYLLDHLFQQVTFLRRYDSPVILTYDLRIIETKEIQLFLDLLNYWMRYSWHKDFKPGYQTLTVFCKLLTTKGTTINHFKLNNSLDLNQIRRVYAFIKEYKPELYKNFYDTESAIYDETKGGIIYDWRRNQR